MPRPVESPEQAEILFCPFCGDGFEGLTECPEHGLTLVAIDRLPRRGRSSSNEVDFFADPRMGRGGVLAGAALVLVGFFLPFVRARGIEASALEVAIDGAHNLWLTPVAAGVMLWVLSARRTRQAMRSARLAVLGLALAGAMPLIYTSRRIGVMAGSNDTEIAWLWGLAVIVAGLGIAALASVRLGGAAKGPG